MLIQQGLEFLALEGTFRDYFYTDGEDVPDIARNLGGVMQHKLDMIFMTWFENWLLFAWRQNNEPFGIQPAQQVPAGDFLGMTVQIPPIPNPAQFDR